ncbi:ribonuclease domain-containing protein [Polaromonas sp. SM01]|jgi:ribonuclease T1|uniref:ribonuclease domain-containing protein n=1 Tax=Polaromonas sp. SM01 TaxID=3085630 RepID=UPI002982726D|nr:ribonuclease domain-containing protein [Polaromonas sp. SM01]MDW5441194.1 ribonuclease domain-containing protein [Polaromonas sp. SM01]
MLRKSWAGWQLAMAVMLAALGTGFSPDLVQAKGTTSGTGISTVAIAELPVQGRNMVRLIYQGGPFKYDKDGSVFGNRERILPAKNRGYYREYTVQTPGERSRGARRIICGGFVPTTPDACYYTDDHYASFRRIIQ